MRPLICLSKSKPWTNSTLPQKLEYFNLNGKTFPVCSKGLNYVRKEGNFRRESLLFVDVENKMTLHSFPIQSVSYFKGRVEIAVDFMGLFSKYYTETHDLAVDIYV